MRFLPILLGFGALVSARCGTHQPSDELRSRHKSYQEREARAGFKPASRDVFQTTIQTYIHIDVLNEDYAPTGFSFNLVNVSYTRNNAWTSIEDGTPIEWEVKSSLRRGGYTDLNLYVGTIGGSILGYATFPKNDATLQEFKLDGVVIDPISLPGGTAPYDLGITAVHEIGHWLNLFHTFQPGNDDINAELPGCLGSGDYIHDTPAEAFPNFGCPKRVDTCTGVNETSNPTSEPGPDPIHNFMDYSDDKCLNQFTPGQVLRMQNSWVDERVSYAPAMVGRRARPGLKW
ncbi:hypothetical protein ARAM_001712 [Aspergillus rambellii]|uniref:Peptidase M43 pregnancy-associated plasma-A domain-containing protein n=1 Tax=Aspergillus rambellii TaxID=308745 RepID=A0A0F8U1A5_9EURO|nr:hypothetical protein ARAM_001712 [Aspergillus rambellii]